MCKFNIGMDLVTKKICVSDCFDFGFLNLNFKAMSL